ncbi:UDP-N-acetylglucosamine 2-epimerase (non-hydrolyzing) [Methanomicrobium sp. W14]|nr:UDP-N-acetylglucosamine 2-epimerase (non-hydrolyzing) [Methanomicrobium sp. W14]
MSDVFFKQLNIPKPDYNLGIGSGSHGVQTGKMLAGIEEVLMKEEPDIVMVYGDTNSTLAGALAASKLNIPVAHVEAGLRSYDRTMPEEINRVMTDHISSLLFCPTKTAVENLEKEGITKGVCLTGDVMVDALQHNLKIAEKESTILKDLKLEGKEYFVATVHRQSNTDSRENLTTIFNAFCEITQITSSPLIFPVHPRTLKYLKKFGLSETIPEGLILTDPLPYPDMLMLMSKAKKILTDSGGIQKEAYILGVPCVTLRENTEWVETINNGMNVLTGSNKNKIISALKRNRVEISLKDSIFKKGNASLLIASKIRSKESI